MPTISEFIQCDSRNYTKGRRGCSVDYIVVHYTGTNASAHNNLLYFSRNSTGASAHYFIDTDGTICQSVSEDSIAWHCGNWSRNCHSIGIENVSSGEDFTDAQKASLRDLVLDIMNRYGISADHVIRHYDVTGKLCPASYVDSSKWDELHAYITGGSASAPSTPEPSEPSHSDSGDYVGSCNPSESILLHDGYFGPLTVKYIQKRLRAAGWYPAGKYIIDGDFGYWTKFYLQKYLRYNCGTYTRNCDGDFGMYSVKALQQHLLNVGCYWDKYGECIVDGDWGSLTTIAIQRAINAGVF